MNYYSEIKQTIDACNNLHESQDNMLSENQSSPKSHTALFYLHNILKITQL